MSGILGGREQLRLHGAQERFGVTGLTCTVTDTATSCTDTDNTVWVAGDTISLQAVPNSGPDDRTATWSVTLG